MLELIRKYENDNRRAARHLVEEFMKIPVDKRSDEMLEKIEQAVEKYRMKAHHLLEKDKKRTFLRKHRAHELDDSFGHADSYPSMFGTQPEETSESDSGSESGEDSEGQEGETGSDEAMDDVDDLSQRLSQLSSTKPERKKRRGKYKKKQKLNDPKIDDDTRRKRMKRIKKKLQEFADEEKLSLIVIIALLLKNESYIHNRNIARVADCIIRDKPLDPYVSIQEAIYLR